MDLPAFLQKTSRDECVRLGLNNLFILPTRFGMLWLSGCLLLLVAGVQVQSNGPLLLGFLMLGLFLLTLHLTHLNLHGLELSCGSPSPGFARDPLTYPVLVRCRGRVEGLRLGVGEETGPPPLCLMPGLHRMRVPWSPARRGLQCPGRLRIQTTAPLGLFVCWSHWDPPIPQMVYPARRQGAVGMTSQRMAGQSMVAASAARHEGSEEWFDLRPRRPQDSSTRLAWKLVAQGRGRFTKQFRDPPRQTLLLTPEPSLPFEMALEHLSERICRLHAQGASYGLEVRGHTLAPDRGAEHRDRCLAALAMA